MPRFLQPLTHVASALALVGCAEPVLELAYDDEAPVEVPANTRVALDVAYDSGAQNLLDLYLPDTDEPAPLFIYVHGGGFKRESKVQAYQGEYLSLMQEVLGSGGAFATIDYELLGSPDQDGVLKSLEDSRRALQFLRYYHASLGIDPDRVIVGGESAGAGTALWLGTRDDMRDKHSDDGVDRETTIPTAVVLWETQATYDLVDWSIVFEEYGLDVLAAAGMFGLEQELLDFYGITDPALVEGDPTIQQYRYDVDMIEQMDGGDAPIFVDNHVQEYTTPISTALIFHHPAHAKLVRDTAIEVDLDVVASIPKMDITADETATEFTLRLLDL